MRMRLTNLDLTNSMDWKLNPNVECRITLEKLNIPQSGKNKISNLRDTKTNVESVGSSDTDTYSKFILLVDELSNFVDKCEDKCRHCEEYIILLQNHVIQTHVLSHTANLTHERDNLVHSSNNSNYESGIYKIPSSSLNIIPNNDEEEGRRTNETPSENRDIGPVGLGSLLNPFMITLENVNQFSTIAENVRQEPDDNVCPEDPLLNLEVPSNVHYKYFPGNVVASIGGQLTGETELNATHSKNLVGNTASTSFPSSGTKLKLFKCSTCGNRFTSSGSLNRHKLMHTGRPKFKCELCEKYFASRQYLIIHQRKHTGERPFKCEVCGQRFSRNQALTTHKLRHAGYVKQEPDNNVCPEDPLLNLEVPSNVHYKYFPGNLVPGSEGQWTGETELIGTHSKNSVGNTASTSFTSGGTKLKSFKCSICGNSYSTRRSLVRHKLLHTGDSKFKCDVCGKGFPCSSNLIIHESTHTSEKPFPCSTCGKCFSTLAYSMRHKKIHTEESRCSCDACGKCFASRQYLIIHQRTHTGERPFKCEVCGQRFSRNQVLTTHKLTHSGKKPFKCDKCGLCFALPYTLKYHKRRRNH